MTNVTGITTHTPPSDDQRTRAKLTDAAQQFEGMLLEEMLKPMRSKDGGWSGEGSSSDDEGDTISNFGIESVAKSISKSGGLGIVRQVVQQVMAEHEKAQPEKSANALPHGGTIHQ